MLGEMQDCVEFFVAVPLQYGSDVGASRYYYLMSLLSIVASGGYASPTCFLFERNGECR